MDCNMDSSESDEDAAAAFMFLYLLQRRIKTQGRGGPAPINSHLQRALPPNPSYFISGSIEISNSAYRLGLAGQGRSSGCFGCLRH